MKQQQAIYEERLKKLEVNSNYEFAILIEKKVGQSAAEVEFEIQR